MYDHIGLRVSDLGSCVRFYEAVLAPLGYELCCRDAASAGFGPKDGPVFWLYLVETPDGQGTHVAFKAANRRAVDGFFASGLASGGQDNGKPGVRRDYSPTYYAAFLIDPAGNNIEAVCMK